MQPREMKSSMAHEFPSPPQQCRPFPAKQGHERCIHMPQTNYCMAQ